MEIELVLDDIERLVKNIRTFTSVLKDMQKVVDNMEPIKQKKQKKFPKPEPLELTEPLPEPLPEPLAELKPVEVQALECEPPKKSKKMRKPKLERS